MLHFREPAVMLSPAEPSIEVIRHVRRLIVFVLADRGQCEVRTAHNGGDFAAGSGASFDTTWRNIAEERAPRTG